MAKLDDMRTRAETAIRNLELVNAVEVPIFTDTERLRNYWNGYLDAIDQIARNGT